MAPNFCCDIKTPQAVDNKKASANLQRRLINPHFFFPPFKLNQRERSMLMERMVWQTRPQDLCSVLKLLRPSLGWEWSLEFHVTHRSMRHASPSQPGSQCCLLCLTKFLEFPGLRWRLYLLQPFVPSLRPLGGGAVVLGIFCFNSTHQQYRGQRSMCSMGGQAPMNREFVGLGHGSIFSTRFRV